MTVREGPPAYQLPYPPDLSLGLCKDPDVLDPSMIDIFHADLDSKSRLKMDVKEQTEMALAICNSGGPDGAPCPVKDACYEYGYALAQELGYRTAGIYGGVDIRTLRRRAG